MEDCFLLSRARQLNLASIIIKYNCVGQMHKYIDSIIIVQLFLSISHYLMSFLRVFFLEFYAIHFRNLYAVNHAFASIDHGSNGNS